jgi:hypothetical protein
MLLGQLASSVADELGRHVESCSRCVGTLRNLQLTDTLTETLRSAAAIESTGPEAHRVEDLIERLSDLPFTVAGGPVWEAAPSAPAEPDDFLAPPELPDEIGRLGPYRILKVLGRGGMGIVFQAEDPQLKRPVAVKVLQPGRSASESARRRFLREARAMAALEHDNIVTLHYVGEAQGMPFLAMQLLRGETLATRLQREGSLRVEEALRIGREIADALAAAHEHGLIHRDIKPGNIWLEAGSGRVKVLDFGLVRAAEEDAQLTQTGIVLGTPAYMAPEQADGEAVDARGDLFSLGCILYQMVAGRLPFVGAGTLAMLRAIALQTPLPLNQVNPDVPEALPELVDTLLAKEPGNRPASAGLVSRQLLRISHAEARMRDEGANVQKASQALGMSKQRDPQQALAATGRPRGRWPARLLVAAVLLVALGLAGVWFAPTVILLATDSGQLVIETDDPDVEVSIQQGGQTVTVVDLKTQQRLRLKAGTYEMQLASGKHDLRLSTDRFTLIRGGKEIVKVRRQETPAVEQVQKASAAASPKPRDVSGMKLILDLDSQKPKNVGVAGLFGGDTGDREYGWVDGEYQIIRKKGFGTASENPLPAVNDLSEFVFEVEGRLTKPASGTWGISWGHWEENIATDPPWLWLHVTTVRTVGVAQVSISDAPGPSVRCAALRPITERNTLRAEVAGTKMRLFVNGQHLTEVEEPRLRPGKVRIFVWTEHPPVEARFSRIRIWRK